MLLLIQGPSTAASQATRGVLPAPSAGTTLATRVMRMQASKHESRLNTLALFIIGNFAPPVSYLPLAVVCAKCSKQLLLDAGGNRSSVRRRSARRTLQGCQQGTAIGAQPSCRYAIEWAAALFEKLGIAVRAELEDVLLEQLRVVHPVKGPASRVGTKSAENGSGSALRTRFS